jgi:hypothetical protein
MESKPKKPSIRNAVGSASLTCSKVKYRLRQSFGGSVQRIHDGVAVPHRLDYVVDGRGTPMVARLADEQQHPFTILGNSVEQLHGVADRVEDSGSPVAGLQADQVATNDSFVAGEIFQGMYLAVESQQSELTSRLLEHRMLALRLDRLLLHGEGPPYVQVGNKKLFRREAIFAMAART